MTTNPTAWPSRLSEREGGKLKRFYYHSGVRGNSSCVKNPTYRMAPLSAGEARERECLRGRGAEGETNSKDCEVFSPHERG